MPDRYATRAWLLFWCLVAFTLILVLFGLAIKGAQCVAQAEPATYEVATPDISLDADRWTFCFADAERGNLCLIVFVEMPGITCKDEPGRIMCAPIGGQP